MNYNDILEDIGQQMSQVSSSKAQKNETPQMETDNLLNTLALEIQRQGG